MGVRKGVWAAGDCATAEPDACEKEEDLSLSVGTDGLVLSLIFGVVVFGLEALFSAVAAAARADAEVLILSLTIAVDVGGGEGTLAGWLAVAMLLLSRQPQLSSAGCSYPVLLPTLTLPLFISDHLGRTTISGGQKTILPTLLAGRKIF